jgi:hypothetical protein
VGRLDSCRAGENGVPPRSVGELFLAGIGVLQDWAAAVPKPPRQRRCGRSPAGAGWEQALRGRHPAAMDPRFRGGDERRRGSEERRGGGDARREGAAAWVLRITSGERRTLTHPARGARSPLSCSAGEDIHASSGGLRLDRRLLSVEIAMRWATSAACGAPSRRPRMPHRRCVKGIGGGSAAAGPPWRQPLIIIYAGSQRFRMGFLSFREEKSENTRLRVGAKNHGVRTVSILNHFDLKAF